LAAQNDVHELESLTLRKLPHAEMFKLQDKVLVPTEAAIGTQFAVKYNLNWDVLAPVTVADVT
jgi:hypothetical protein